MNKSVLVNGLAALIVVAGILLAQEVLLSVGLFALSGALTNWLAVYMLFERVPGLYGSGVIPARFEDFKQGIHSLMMEQFFSEENIDRFLSGEQGHQPNLHLEPVINKMDLSPAFDALVSAVMQSSFGGMLGMLGGEKALSSLQEPFIDRMKEALIEMSRSEEFIELLREEYEQPDVMADMRGKVEGIVEKRLDELTPQLVKEIVQRMIREHLGWLVVWGGVFGGLIGLVAAFVPVQGL